MGNRQSTKEKQQDKHPFNKDTKKAALKKKTDQSSFAKLPTPTGPDDLNHGKSKDLTGDLNNTDALRSDILQQLKDAPETLSQQQTYKQVTCGNTLYEESKGFTPSEQKPEAKETTEGQKARTVAPRDKGTSATADNNAGVSASVQVPAQVLCKDASRQVECSEVVREAEANMKTRINKSPSQKANCVFSNVNEESFDLTCHATDKARGIGMLMAHGTSTKPDVADVPAYTPTEPPNRSTQMSNQPRTQVNNEENALQEPGSNHNNVTNLISVEYQYCFRAKSETSRAVAAKMRLRQKLAKKLKAQPQDGSKSSQQTVEETATVRESSQPQGCTAMEAKKHKEPHKIPQLNKADCNTNGKPSSCIQKANVKALEPQVPVLEQRSAAAPNITPTHHPTTAAANVKLRLQCQQRVSLPQDAAVKPKKKCTSIALNQNQPKEKNVSMEEKLTGDNDQAGKEKPEPGITTATPPEHKICTVSRWHPFTVNQSCSCKARCHHNPGTGLPPNVQKWFDECPNYLCEPPWVTTAKLAACLALREAQEEGGDSHQ